MLLTISTSLNGPKLRMWKPQPTATGGPELVIEYVTHHQHQLMAVIVVLFVPLTDNSLFGTNHSFGTIGYIVASTFSK